MRCSFPVYPNKPPISEIAGTSHLRQRQKSPSSFDAWPGLKNAGRVPRLPFVTTRHFASGGP